MGSYNFDAIASSMGKMLETQDAKVREASEKDLSDTGNLIAFQKASGDWSTSVSLYSTTIKQLTDALNSIVQKM